MFESFSVWSGDSFPATYFWYRKGKVPQANMCPLGNHAATAATTIYGSKPISLEHDAEYLLHTIDSSDHSDLSSLMSIGRGEEH